MGCCQKHELTLSRHIELCDSCSIFINAPLASVVFTLHLIIPKCWSDDWEIFTEEKCD